MSKIPTFREFIGKMPEFDDPVKLARYLYTKEIEYISSFCGVKPSIKAIRHLFHRKRTKNLPRNDYRRLSEIQKEQYKKTRNYLEMALWEGGINQSHLEGTCLDFGCGEGGSSIFLNQQNSNVIAIDTNEQLLDKLKKTGIFPSQRIVKGDGLEYMLKHPKTYDLITSLAFGGIDPQTTMQFVDYFYMAATQAIKPGGRIWVLSDLLTMDKLRKAFGTEFNPYSPYGLIYKA